MRPRGSFGGVARALLDAANHGPGPVRELAERAQVGYRSAAVNCSRLVARGELVVLDADERPAKLARPSDAVNDVDAALDELGRSFWERQA